MNILVIADTRNRWSKSLMRLRRDGNEFRREARAFAQHWECKGASVTVVETKAKKSWKKYKLVLDAIKNHDGPIHYLALFCHGWHDGISLGFSRYHIPALVQAIRSKDPYMPRCFVLLYACSAFKCDNSFGPILGEKLGCLCLTFGHSTKGHTTRNPFVYQSYFYEGRKPWIPEIALGWWARRKSAAWKEWKAKMKTDYRFYFWSE